MDLNEILINTIISTISGVVVAIAITWAYKSVHMRDGEVKFGKGFLERYIWKYLFISAFLFAVALISSLLVALLYIYKINIYQIFSLIIILLLFIAITIKRRWIHMSEQKRG